MGFGVVVGPSADGVPLANVTVTGVSVVNGCSGRNASQRPSGTPLTAWVASSSASTSAAVAGRIATSASSAVNVVVASTASASICWSNTATKTGCSGRPDPLGENVFTDTAGVLNRKLTCSARVAPVADFVPAGTVTVYSVAIGSRSTWSLSPTKRSVWVPIHSQ